METEPAVPREGWADADSAAAAFRQRRSLASLMLRACAVSAMRVATHRAPRAVSSALLLAEFVQLVSFAVDPAYYSGGWLHGLYAGLRRVRDPAESRGCPAAAAVFGAFVLACYAAGAVQVRAVLNGGTGSRALHVVQRYAAALLRLAYLPALYAFAGCWTDPERPWGLGYKLPAALAIALTFPIVTLVSNAVMTGVTPSKTSFFLWLPRYDLWWTAVKTALFVSDVVLKRGAAADVSSARLSSHAAITSALLATTYAISTLSDSFVRPSAAYVFSFFMSGMALSPLVGLVTANVAGEQPRNVLGVLGLVALAVGGAAGVLGYRWRARHPELPVPFARASPNKSLRFRYEHCFDLATRFVYKTKDPTESDILLADATLEEGIKAFPQSPYLKFARALFLLEKRPNPEAIRALVQEGLALCKPWEYDLRFRLFIVSQIITVHESLSNDEQQDLFVADAARRVTAEFWERLASMRQSVVVDHTELLEIVRSISRHERKAEAIFRSLLGRNAQSSLLLRKYAAFLDEILDDKEQAEMLFQLADGAEEMKNLEGRMRKPKRNPVEIRIQAADGGDARPVADEDDSKSEGAKESRAHSPSNLSMSSAGASSVTDERAKILDYRLRTTGTRSKALRRVQLVAGFVFVACLCGAIVIFSTSSRAVQTTRTNFAKTEALVDIAREFTQLAVYLRQVQLSRMVTWGAGLQANETEEQMAAIYAEALAGWKYHLAVIADTNDSNVVPVVLYVPGANESDPFSGKRVRANTTILDAASTWYQHALHIHSELQSTRSPELLESDDCWRFVFDNLAAIHDGLVTTGHAQRNKSSSSIGSTIRFVSIFCGAFYASIVLLAVLTLIPALLVAERERKAIASLFMEIPKSTCVNLFERFRHAKGEASEHESESIVDTSSKMAVPIVLRIRLMTGAFMSLILCCAAGLVLTLVLTGQANELTSYVVLYTGLQKCFFYRSWEDAQYQATFKYEQAFTQPDAFALLYNWECPAETGETCTGLYSLQRLFMDHMASLLLQDTIGSSDQAFAVLSRSVQSISQGLARNEQISMQAMRDAAARSTAISTTIFVFALIVTPLAIGLLLLAPQSVIQQSEAEIVEEQEKKTKMILNACKDSVILTNETGVIEMINPAGEALLGYASDELLKRPLVSVLAPRAAKMFEQSVAEFLKHARSGHTRSFAFAKDQKGEVGKDVHVLVSTATALTVKGATFAIFAKDISHIKENEARIDREKRRADELLLNILPAKVAESLKAEPGKLIAQKYKSVTILFGDLVEFTPLAGKMEPYELVLMLNELFSPWDAMCESFGVEKVKTLGDCYMAVSGLPVERPDHAERVCSFTLAALEALAQLNARRVGKSLQPLSIRFGAHSGPVIAGVIGSHKWAYDIWGTSVNVALKVESSGYPNRLCVSSDTKALLGRAFGFEHHTSISIKGKGDIDSWLVHESDGSSDGSDSSDEDGSGSGSEGSQAAAGAPGEAERELRLPLVPKPIAKGPSLSLLSLGTADSRKSVVVRSMTPARQDIKSLLAKR
eukprot:m51a1_g10732 putative adenylate guanylate cyclase (1529) ;mRNA; r:291286-298103